MGVCRQNPGQYEYYKNYDDLEARYFSLFTCLFFSLHHESCVLILAKFVVNLQIHFRQDHFLCENETCLAKKFIVFQSESEMKVLLVHIYRTIYWSLFVFVVLILV